MSSKKKESKKLFEGMSVEPEHANPELPESAHAQEEQAAETLDENAAEQPVVLNADNNLNNESQAKPDESTADDVLEDVRRSLIEEEQAHEKEEQPKWWKRIGRGSRKQVPQPESSKMVEEINV